MAIDEQEVPRLDMGDLNAEWAPDDGVVYLAREQSAIGELSMTPAHILSPDEIRQLYAWVEAYHLT